MKSLMRFLLTRKGQEPGLELYKNEDASSHFAKPRRLVLTDPHLGTGNSLLAGLPFKKDINIGAVSN